MKQEVWGGQGCAWFPTPAEQELRMLLGPESTAQAAVGWCPGCPQTVVTDAFPQLPAGISGRPQKAEDSPHRPCGNGK